MKRLLTLFATVVLVATLAACGSSDSGSESTSGSDSTGTAAADGGARRKVTLALATQSGCPFCIAVQRGAEAAAEERGIELDTVVPRNPDAAAQVQQLEGTLANPPEMLLLLPYDSTALVASAKRFKEKGIPTITIDTDIADPSQREGVVSSDNERGGQIAAQELVRQVGGSGKVLYVGYLPGASTTDARLRGFEQEIESAAGIEYLKPQFTNADPAQAAAKVSAVLKANPDIKGIFAADEGNAIGVGSALKQAGKDGEVKVVAFDGAPDEVNALRQGTFDVLVVQKAYEMGYTALMQAADKLQRGTAVPPSTNPEFVVVTADNLTDPEVEKYLYPAE